MFACLAYLSLSVATTGCAASAEDGEDTGVVAQAETTVPCTPAVIVVRHADDMRKSSNGDAYGTGWDSNPEACVTATSAVEIPGGTQSVRQHCLTPNGKAHANLYASELTNLIAAKNFCPATKVVTQEPYALVDGSWPSANPFETIRPFAMSVGAPITFVSAKETFATASARTQHLVPAPGTSIVVAWDKQGLWGSSNDGLLSQLSAGPGGASFPDRDMVYVFTNADANAKLDRAEYRQFFKDSAGYFATHMDSGVAFDAAKYYRFRDGYLGATAPQSPTFPVSAMTICTLAGEACTAGGGASGVTINQNSPRDAR